MKMSANKPVSPNWKMKVMHSWLAHGELLDVSILLLKRKTISRSDLQEILMQLYGLSRSTALRRIQQLEAQRIVIPKKTSNGNGVKEHGHSRNYRLNPRLRPTLKDFLSMVGHVSRELTETRLIIRYKGHKIEYEEIKKQ